MVEAPKLENQTLSLGKDGIPLLITVALAAFLLLPVALVFLGAFLSPEFLGIASETWAAEKSGWLTFHWFGYVWNLYGEAFFFSLRLAALSVMFCLILALPAAYLLALRPFKGSRLLEEIALLPLAIPGIGLAVALIQTWTLFRGESWLILAGHLLYTLPFMLRVLLHALRSMPVKEWGWAARSLGADSRQRFLWVTLPNLRPALMLGSLLVFAISWGEFNISFLLNTPLRQTFPAALYATYTSNSFSVSSAATVIFLAGIAPVLALIQWFGGKHFTGIGQGA